MLEAQTGLKLHCTLGARQVTRADSLAQQKSAATRPPLPLRRRTGGPSGHVPAVPAPKVQHKIARADSVAQQKSAATRPPPQLRRRAGGPNWKRPCLCSRCQRRRGRAAATSACRKLAVHPGYPGPPESLQVAKNDDGGVVRNEKLRTCHLLALCRASLRLCRIEATLSNSGVLLWRQAGYPRRVCAGQAWPPRVGRRETAFFLTWGGRADRVLLAHLALTSDILSPEIDSETEQNKKSPRVPAAVGSQLSLQK